MEECSYIIPEHFSSDCLPSQTEVMQSWSGREISVSVACICFNHGKYIESALKSFVLQRTNFPFEIIVHDDASDDESRVIIEKYCEKYPDIIKPILQSENQYSQGKKCSLIAYSYARGKYIALCEGDDYWIDSLKLQRQFEYMEKSSLVDLSFHSAVWHYEDSRKKNFVYAQRASGSRMFTQSDMILGKGQFCPTASLMFRRSLIENLPSWYYRTTMGDHYLQILGASRGGVLFVNRCMSVYRNGVPGSWTKRKRDSLDFRLEKALIGNLLSIEEADEYFGYRYANQFARVKKSRISTFTRELYYSDASLLQKVKYYSDIRRISARVRGAGYNKEKLELEDSRLTLYDWLSYVRISYKFKERYALKALRRYRRRVYLFIRSMIFVCLRKKAKSVTDYEGGTRISQVSGFLFDYNRSGYSLVSVGNSIRDIESKVEFSEMDDKSRSLGDPASVPLILVKSKFEVEAHSLLFKGKVVYDVGNVVVPPPRGVLVCCDESPVLCIPVYFKLRSFSFVCRFHRSHLPIDHDFSSGVTLSLV